MGFISRGDFSYRLKYVRTYTYKYEMQIQNRLTNSQKRSGFSELQYIMYSIQLVKSHNHNGDNEEVKLNIPFHSDYGRIWACVDARF